ncbi:MAG: hypothetical protein PVF82_16365, partial [Gammaproteobacteria bacterium]
MNIQAGYRSLLPILVRFTLYFSSIAAGVLAVFSSLEYHKFVLERSRSQGEEILRLSLASRALQTDLHEPLKDIEIIASLQVLSNYIDNQTPANRARLEQEFLNIAENAHIYDQIRFIDSSGMERVRVNFDGRAAMPAPLNQLQNKSQRYYFRETIRLQANAIFISP